MLFCLVAVGDNVTMHERCEYRILSVGLGGTEVLLGPLNRLGGEGWDLVQTYVEDQRPSACAPGAAARTAVDLDLFEEHGTQPPCALTSPTPSAKPIAGGWFQRITAVLAVFVSIWAGCSIATGAIQGRRCARRSPSPRVLDMHV